MKHSIKGLLRSIWRRYKLLCGKAAFRIFEYFPRDESLIVFESEGDLADNAYALYEYLAQNGYMQKYKAVWLVDSLEHAVPYPNTYFAYKSLSRIKTAYYLAVCSWFIYDHCNMLANVRKRKGCTIINLWHGCSFKGNKGGRVNDRTTDKCILTGKLWRSVFKTVFGYDNGMMHETGYPRNDYFFRLMNDKQKAFAEKLGLGCYRKIYLWMPTFRRSWSAWLDEEYFDSQTGLPVLKDFSQLEGFNDYLAKNNCFCIFKIHHLQAELEAFNMTYSNFTVLKDEELAREGLQLYQIVPFADCLITDYSSIANDFFLLDRPIIYTVDDYEDYRESRGFMIEDPVKYFAGHLVKDEEELFAAMDDINNENDRYQERRHELMPLMHTHIDGDSCRRVTELIGLHH